MAAHRWRLPVLIVVGILCGFGCNPLMLPFLLTNMDPHNDPICKLSSPDKEVKVMILAYAGIEPRPEFLQADRELARRLTEILRKRFAENSEKVKILAPSRVDNFKDRFLDWRTWPPEKIGKHFGADYIINLELMKMSLYETGSFNQLFHGHAAISVTAIDVKKPEGEQTVFSEEYACEYPRARGPISTSDMSPLQFRQQFLSRIANDISHYFSAWPSKERYDCD